MNKRLNSVLTGLAMLGMVATTAEAATIGAVISSTDLTHVPNPILVVPGETFTITLGGWDFVNNADAGDFKASWDTSKLTYVGTNISNPPWDASFKFDGNVSTGTLDNVSVGTSTFGGVGPDFPIAELTFKVVGAAGSSTVIDLEDALVGWFAPGTVAITGLTYVDPQVGFIPIPAALWLFATGLLGLVGLAKRKVA
jgi:hypothetical protein